MLHPGVTLGPGAHCGGFSRSILATAKCNAIGSTVLETVTGIRGDKLLLETQMMSVSGCSQDSSQLRRRNKKFSSGAVGIRGFTVTLVTFAQKLICRHSATGISDAFDFVL